MNRACFYYPSCIKIEDWWYTSLGMAYRWYFASALMRSWLGVFFLPFCEHLYKSKYGYLLLDLRKIGRKGGPDWGVHMDTKVFKKKTSPGLCLFFERYMNFLPKCENFPEP